MRILDRYVVRQLLPVWVWCLAVFIFLSCLIDLFEHLDEILRYQIPTQTVVQYYLNFMPIVFVRASPLALLLGSAFIAMRLSRHHEWLAMNATGTSLLRAGVPFVFVGWIAALSVFAMNDLVIPNTSLVYERLRQEAFRGRQADPTIENVALIDHANRLYHARELDLKAKELHDLTVLEHNWSNQPTKSLYANRAIWTKHGWLLLHGTIYRVGPRGVLRGEPEPFVERLIPYPVTVESFSQPEAKPETMRYAQLRWLISRLKQTELANVRRYEVALAAKLSLPFVNVLIGFLGFAGATQVHARGNLRGVGLSLGWGLLYYLGVAVGQSVAAFRFLPVVIPIWAPHGIAVWWCIHVMTNDR